MVDVTVLKTVIRLTVLLASPLMAAPGDTLSVVGDDVNVRDGPSLAHNVVLELHQGNTVREIQRKDKWIEIAELATGKKLGWIHITLIETVPDNSPGTAYPAVAETGNADGRFQVFLASFEKLGANMEKETGLVFFTKAEELGNGNIQIMATNAWVQAPEGSKTNIMNILFRLWDEADGRGSPIAVFIVDEHGTQHMSMYR